MRPYLTLLGLCAVGTTAFVAGCLLMPEGSKIPRPVAEALDGPDRAVSATYSFTLYSLEPDQNAAASPNTPSATESFHGYPVLGKTEVKDAVVRRKLVAAFNHGVHDHDGSAAACFLPHHGIRVQKGKDIVDLVICFQCAQVKMFNNGEPLETLLISTSPRAAFNDVLDRARVPVSKAGR
jgi:hypothetical protein